MFVEIREGEIDVSEVRSRLQLSGTGAVVVFEGIIRPSEEGKRVDAVYYEAYREMAERQMESILEEAGREGIMDAAAVHRIGLVRAGETSVVVAVCSEHRAEAFRACAEIIAKIKETVPIWKKEVGEVSRWK